MRTRSYDSWLQEAKNRGWVVPAGDVVTQPGWHQAWIHYWTAMAEFESMERCGRPVPPHRSALTTGEHK